MPWCLNRTYRRLEGSFDETLGESYYNPMLADVVQSLDRGVARPSEGAIAIFFREEAAGPGA